MSEKRYVHISEREGVQHCHGENCDEYFYRPLVYGKDLFTYVAHIPPGGGVPGDQEEADMFEMSLFILNGTATVNYGEESFTMEPNNALHCPKGVPVGFENHTDEPVTLLLSFSPSPKGATNEDEMRALIEARGRSTFSAAVMNEMAGEYWLDS